MKRYMAMLVTALVVALGLFNPAPANADPDPTFAGSIGVIPNKGTREGVYISRDRWGGARPQGPYATIYPNHNSREFWPDTDIIYVPANRDIVTAYYTSYGWQANGRITATGWHAISTDLYVWVTTD